ncbi:O-antigen ligase family protein [Rhizocola hellebori]|uniref:O-antigen ligase family protein n=1 Tax=Rhizocola hellebori TaxID=1392758 RepID=UPI001942249E|nr:O-antigen ligase family protein [Rhizocola hellebori]
MHPVDFEPSLIGDSTYASRRRHTRFDTAAWLGFMLVLLYVLPGEVIVPNMTYAGRPALLLSLMLCCWWMMTRLNPRLAMTGPQPVRWAVFAYFTTLLISYLAGLIRGLTGVESNAQNFAMLAALEFVGVILLAADGIGNWERLKLVLQVYVVTAGFMAMVAMVQAFLKFDLAHYLTLPGLEFKGGLVGFERRGPGAENQFRVAGTAQHYIEFSVCMAMAAPFALHLARFAEAKWQRRGFAVVAGMCAAAIPISISRTGILALALAVLVMFPMWSWRIRYNLIILGMGLVGAIAVAKPGVLGTLRSLFFAGSEDPSVQGRLLDYTFVNHWFAQRPILGRGPRTLVPELYGGIVLDNQWLYTLVTGGIVGVLALAALHITGITLAGIALRRSTREEDRHLCSALIASQVIALVVAVTFDSMYYTSYTSTLALLLGFCGAVWRFTHPARTIRTLAVRRRAD